MASDPAPTRPMAADVAEQLIAAASEGLAAVDRTGDVLTWSPSMARITGISPGEAVGRPLAALIPALATEDLHLAWQGQTVSRQNLACGVPASRQPLWLDVHVTPLRQAEAVTGAILAVSDVTARRRTDAQIQETEQRFTTMANVAPVLLWMARTDSLCTFFNQTWLDFTGRTLDQEWGVGWAENVHPEDVQRCLDTYESAFSARQTFEMEYRLRRADGVYRWILDRGTPRYGPDGGFAGYIGSCIDISDLKQLELDLRQAVKTRDEFLSIASHELRTPVTTLGLQSENLLRSLAKQAPDQPPSPWLIPRLETIRRQARRLETLVAALLDVSRLASGRLPLSLQAVDLTAVVREVVERFTDEATRRGSALTLQAHGPVIGCWDPLRLDQVVTNLIANALTYGQGQPIEIWLETSADTVRLHVRDHGIGIAPADQARIFGQFERAVSESHYGGFGIGLWIASQIVQAFQGTITVDSQPGEGACFTVTLGI